MTDLILAIIFAGIGYILLVTHQVTNKIKFTFKNIVLMCGGVMAIFISGMLTGKL